VQLVKISCFRPKIRGEELPSADALTSTDAPDPERVTTPLTDGLVRLVDPNPTRRRVYPIVNG